MGAAVVLTAALIASPGASQAQDAVTPGGVGVEGKPQDDGAPDARIAGRVTSETTGEGLFEAQVIVFAPFDAGGAKEEWEQHTNTYADEEGNYEIFVPAGRYRVGYFYFKHVDEYWRNVKNNIQRAQDVVLQSNDRRTFNVEMSEDAEDAIISGTVTSTAGDPISSGRVRIWNPINRGGGVEWNEFTSALVDRDGSYRAEVWPGRYRLDFLPEREGLQMEWWENKPTRATATDISVGSGGTHEFDAVLSETAGLAGRVVNPSDAAIRGITVTAYAKNSSGRWRAVRSRATSATGSFDFELRPGTYRVGYKDRRGRYETEYFNNRTTLKNARSLTLKAGNTKVVDAALPR